MLISEDTVAKKEEAQSGLFFLGDGVLRNQQGSDCFFA